MLEERFNVKEIVAEIVPTYHIRKEDKERDSVLYEELCELGGASLEEPVVGKES